MFRSEANAMVNSVMWSNRKTAVVAAGAFIYSDHYSTALPSTSDLGVESSIQKNEGIYQLEFCCHVWTSNLQ